MNVLNKIELYSTAAYLVCYLFKTHELFLKLTFGRITDLYST